MVTRQFWVTPSIHKWLTSGTYLSADEILELNVFQSLFYTVISYLYEKFVQNISKQIKICCTVTRK